MKKQNKIWFLILAIMGVFLILTNGCKKNEEIPTVPILTTSAVSNITITTATCGGIITSDGGSPVTARGVCWSIGQNPTIANSKTANGTGTDSFTSSITGLVGSTTYHIRSYATNSAGTAYGNELTFTTSDVIVIPPETVTDIDGNVYHTVKIDTQVWMVENLKTTKYRNGDPIPNVTDPSAWSTLATGAYVDYNKDVNNSTAYGRLYNSYAARDSRNIAPTGWHVASNDEWTALLTTLGEGSVAGGKLKEVGTTHWQTPNTGATNVTGFTALPGGTLHKAGSNFNSIGTRGFWWTTTVYAAEPPNVYSLELDYDKSNLIQDYSNPNHGYSVRCLKN